MTFPTHNIDAPKRVPFLRQIVVLGPDYTAGDFKMDLRASPGATGDPIVGLTKQTAGTQGISATYNAAYVYGVGLTAPATIYLVQIDESTLEALSLADPSDEPLVLHYDLHVTPSGGAKYLQLQGEFRVFPGVTI